MPKIYFFVINKFIFLMDYSHFFTKDLKEVSKAFCELSIEEVEKVQEMALSMDTVSKKRFARLLIYRGDASRLLNLLDSPDYELQKSCIRSLKTGPVRKTLYASFKDEETFITMFTKVTSKAKQVLLECLVWNKERPAGCLADKLYDNSSLVLTADQRRQLLGACSAEKYLLASEEKQRCRKVVVEMSQKEIEEICVRELYKDFKAGKKELDKYIPYLKHWWKMFTVEGKEIRLYDLILDIFVATRQRAAQIVLDNLPYISSDSSVNGKGTSKQFSARSIYDAIDKLLQRIPIYIFKRLNITTCEGYFVNGIRRACHYVRNAYLVGEKEIGDFFLNQLTYPDIYNPSLGSNCYSELEEIKSYLPKESVDIVINGLLDRILKELEERDPTSSIVWSNYQGLILALHHYIPREDERMKKVMELFATYEQQFKQAGGNREIYFYATQQSEIPLDFAYQQCDRKMISQYKTARQFERILCLKGNTYLNKKENSDRKRALELLSNIVAISNDARAVHRYVEMFLRTDLKFADLNPTISVLHVFFSPDCLGLSSISAMCSGTPEEAAQARMNIVNSLVEWAGLKKGSSMVAPLVRMVCLMFAYASAYPAFQDTYCAMMKPLVQFLVNKEMGWTWNDLESNVEGRNLRRSLLEKSVRCGGPMSDQQMEALRPYVEQEKKMIAGEVMKYMVPVHACDLYYLDVSFPHPQLPVFSRVCVEMVLSMLEQTEKVEAEHVINILDKMVSSVLEMSTNNSSKEEIMGSVPGDDSYEVIKTTTHVTESMDIPLLREVFLDLSFKWEGCIPGLSVLQSLSLMPNLRKPSFLSRVTDGAPVDKVSLSLREKKEIVKQREMEKKERAKKEKQEKKKNLYLRLSGDRLSLLKFQLSQGVEMYNQFIARAIRDDMRALPQTANVATVALDGNGLEWCLDTLNSCYIVPYFLNGCRFNVPFTRRMIGALSEENLQNMFSLARVFFHVAVQSAILAISLNKSDKPITETSITSNLNIISRVMLDNIQILTLLNQEIAYRKLEVAEKEITLQCNAPFLAAFLQSVKEGTKQEMKMLTADDTFVLADTPVTAVTLDVTQNAVVGRMIELLFYNQTIGQYFNTKLPSICAIIGRLDISVIFAICRRLLVVSIYVPYAGNLLTTIIRSFQDPAILGQVVDVFYDVHRSLSVALLTLIFRVAAMPAMSGLTYRMKTLIKKITEYVTSNNFQSISAYTAILKWAYSTLLQNAKPDLEFIRSLLVGFTTLSLNSEAGRFMFNVMMAITYDACGLEFNNFFNKEAKETVAKLSVLRLQASEERRTILKTLLQEVVVMYNLQQDDNDLAVYLKHLNTLKLVTLPETTIALAKELVEMVGMRCMNDRRTALTEAIKLLYAVDRTSLIASVQKGIHISNTLRSIPDETTLTVAKMEELGIPEPYHKQLTHNHNCVDLVAFLKCRAGIPLPILLDILVELKDEGLVAHAAMAKVLKSAATFPDETEVVTEMDKKKYIDVEKLIDGVQTMEPWMFVMLKDSLLTSFHKSVGKEVLLHFREKETVATAGLLYAISTSSSYSRCDDDEEEEKKEEEEISMRGYVCNWIKANHVYALYPALM